MNAQVIFQQKVTLQFLSLFVHINVKRTDKFMETNGTVDASCLEISSDNYLKTISVSWTATIYRNIQAGDEGTSR